MAHAMMIAAPSSHAGKTTVTLALLMAFRGRGLRVRAAKAGPDYIDPAFHAAATGRPCLNLDTWAMPPDLLDRLVAVTTRDADLLIIEAAMGLFDGAAGPPSGEGRAAGRAADLAARFRLPVILVLDVTGQSQSAAVTARGFALHDPDVKIAGVILNRVGSPRHTAAIADALADQGITLFGALPRDPALKLPERHLGLVQAMEHRRTLPGHLQRLGDMAETHFDLDAIYQAAGGLWAPARPARQIPPPGQRIAIAQDRAFSFVYPHLVTGWRDAGAEISFFSPLADQAPPADADVCWLPGGYPELYGATLAAAERFRTGMIGFAQTRPVHGECGGYMVLGQAIIDADSRSHRMLGLLSQTTSFAARRLHLGYREARLLSNGMLGRCGTLLRGHEFHYATQTEAGTDAAFAALTDAAGNDLGPGGGRRGMVSGSFFHVMA